MSADISVFCTLWRGKWSGFRNRGNRSYSPVYIERLKDMVERNTTYEIDFKCFTNLDPASFPGDIDVVKLKTEEL